MTLGYLYSKFFKKIVRGKSILDSEIDETVHIGSGSTVYNCVIGRYSYMGYDCEVINTEIGSFCSLSSGVHIGLAEHPIEWISTSPVFQGIKRSSIKRRFAQLPLKKPKRTVIENDVWIGTNVIIKAGVHVETGAVIASGAVVTKDVEPYAVVGGCPAKLIKYRFREDIRNRLLRSNWWSLDEDELERVGDVANNPEAFLNALYEHGFIE